VPETPTTRRQQRHDHGAGPAKAEERKLAAGHRSLGKSKAKAKEAAVFVSVCEPWFDNGRLDTGALSFSLSEIVGVHCDDVLKLFFFGDSLFARFRAWETWRSSTPSNR
jgi:hypothetical protein